VTVGEANTSSVVTVLSTMPDAETADRIGSALVEERLAACANILDGVTSIYRWKGSVEKEREALMVLKTTSGTVERLRLRLVELHPYDVPEVVALGVSDGHEPYLDWVRSAVGPDV
jgi:periplasmic divalent cation tolerance protein